MVRTWKKHYRISKGFHGVDLNLFGRGKCSFCLRPAKSEAGGLARHLVIEAKLRLARNGIFTYQIVECSLGERRSRHSPYRHDKIPFRAARFDL